LAKDLKQAIVIEVLKTRVILLELPFHWTVEQLHVRIGKGGKRSVDGDRSFIRGGYCGKGTGRVSGGGGSGGGFEESSAVDTKIHAQLFLSTRTGVENVYYHQIHPRDPCLSTAFAVDFSWANQEPGKILDRTNASGCKLFRLFGNRLPKTSGLLAEEPNEAILRT
jgi:hypothetical protein